MFNFDFMKDDSGDPAETVYSMLRSLNEAKNRCKNLFASRGGKIRATSVRVRENGGSKILYAWSEVA